MQVVEYYTVWYSVFRMQHGCSSVPEYTRKLCIVAITSISHIPFLRLRSAFAPPSLRLRSTSPRPPTQVYSQSLKPIVDFVMFSVQLSANLGIAGPVGMHTWFAVAALISTGIDRRWETNHL